MNLHHIIFYLLAYVIALATLLAITRKQLVHAVVYLVISLVATAVLFALLGAPLPAVLQVMIPAGAVMVLFLFIIILIGREALVSPSASRKRWIAPGILSGIVLVCALALLAPQDSDHPGLALAIATARQLGHFVYDRYWPAVEAISVLFFVALAGAMFLVRDFTPSSGNPEAGEEQRS